MKRTAFIIAVVFVCVATIISIALAQQHKGGGFSSAQQPGAWYANSYALVVGINSYSHGWGRLSAGVNDAKKMATALRSRGFQVDELYDKEATSSAIIAALRQAAIRTSANDGFVFYYSGHGFTKTSEWDKTQAGYLVPVDGRSGDMSNYLAVTQLRDEILTNCKAKHVLLIVDSCFSGTLLTRSGVSDGAVADYLGKRGIYGITAGMQDQTAVDGLFASVLLDGLDGNADFNNDGYVAFKELGMYAEQNVKSRNQRQTPDYGVMYGAGQFVFARKGSAPPPTPAAVTAQPDYQAPDLSAYDADAQAVQQRIAEARAREDANRSAKQDAIRTTYQKVKGYHDSAEYSAEAKKKVYRRFLGDFPDDNPYYDDVNGWLNEPDAEAVGGMAQIPAGWFQMGCSPGDGECDSDENPRKRVYVDSFFIDTHEVTQSEYAQVIGTNPSHYKNCPDCPVEKVSWHDARNYCAKVGKRLPTEAEWEFAARGGTTGARYGDLDSVAWYESNSGKKTHPVGQKQPNAYGLYDMLGNVWEWCEDWYDDRWYSKMPERNPLNSQNNSARVLRGGSWIPCPRSVRASVRIGNRPSITFSFVGFRCVGTVN